jgi:hypothetical protein
MSDPTDTGDHQVAPPLPDSGGFDASWLYTPEPGELRACTACGLVVVNGAEELHGHLHDLLDWGFAHRAEAQSSKDTT